jgi:phosphate transport system permease protein
MAHLSFYTQAPVAPTILTPDQIGGVSTAITGTLCIIFYATLISVPLGVATGVYVAENNSRLAKAIRLVAGTMSGAPSILMGLFAMGFMIQTLGIAASALDGAVALSILMLPVITIATEIAVRAVPQTYREAGLALGAKSSRVSLRVVLPAARTAIVSASLLAISRAIGETAPIVFVIGEVNKISFNPLSPVQALPALLYSNLASPFPAMRQEAWGMGLFLVLMIFALSLSARFWAARAERKTR